MAKGEVVCEADCVACGEVVKLCEIGFTVCPHCGRARAELTVLWEYIEEKEDE